MAAGRPSSGTRAALEVARVGMHVLFSSASPERLSPPPASEESMQSSGFFIDDELIKPGRETGAPFLPSR